MDQGLVTLRNKNEPEEECRVLDDEECGVELLKEGSIQQCWQSGCGEQQISGTVSAHWPCCNCYLLKQLLAPCKIKQNT